MHTIIWREITTPVEQWKYWLRPLPWAAVNARVKIKVVPPPHRTRTLFTHTHTHTAMLCERAHFICVCVRARRGKKLIIKTSNARTRRSYDTKCDNIIIVLFYHMCAQRALW